MPVNTGQRGSPVQEIISAIDIGTTKICTLTAGVTHDSLGNLALRIMGEGQAPSRGIRRGVVVNVQEATASIAEAVERCEADMGQRVVSAYVGIAGSHIGTLNSKWVAPIDRRQGVTSNDMQRALEGARAVALPQNQEVIHAIARQWTVDGQSHVQQPMGMNAYRLEVDAHIVTGSSTAVNNLVQCVMAHGIDVDELVLEPLASNRTVLRPEERHMGVAVIDIGGGTTDVAVFIEEGLCHTQILDLGGNHLTNDLAVGLHAPYETAEELKVRYGNVLPERVADDEKVWATVFGEKAERSFSRRFICEVLEARAIEMFEIIREKLLRSLGQEVPHALTVEIERYRQQGTMIRIHALIWVEREGQKAIVIGQGGDVLKKVGERARLDLEKMLDHKVYLELWVKVKKGWSDDERALHSLGYVD